MHVPFMRFPAHVSCNMPNHFSERMNSSGRALPGRGISYAKGVCRSSAALHSSDSAHIFRAPGSPTKKFSQRSKQGHALTAAPSLAFQANHEPFIAKFHQQSKKNFLFGVDTWKIVPIVRVCFSGTHSQGRRS